MLRSPGGLEGINAAALYGSLQLSFRVRTKHSVTLCVRTLRLSQSSSGCWAVNIYCDSTISCGSVIKPCEWLCLLCRGCKQQLSTMLLFGIILDVNNDCRRRSYWLFGLQGVWFRIVDLLLLHQFFISSKTFRLSLSPNG